MAEASYQLDWLRVAIQQARRQAKGTTNRKLHVIFMCGVDEATSRKHRHYTVAMYLRHLLILLRSHKTVAEVVDVLERRLTSTPTSNTGVNSDGCSNEPPVTVVSYAG